MELIFDKTKSWKTAKIHKTWDLYFNYKYFKFGICYRPKTILFWIKKYYSNINSFINNKNI